MSARTASAAACVNAGGVAVETTPPSQSGYMEREEGPFKIWKKRFFELRGGQLWYWRNLSEAPGGSASARGSLAVSGAVLRALEPKQASGRLFALGLKQHGSTTREYVMLAPNEQSRIEWLTALVHAGGSMATQVRSPQRSSVIVTSSSAAAAIAAGIASDRKMFAASSHEGWLLKLGGVQKTTFQSRYFVLLGNHLTYYKNAVFGDDVHREQESRGTIHLQGAVLAVEAEAHSLVTFGHAHVFTLTPVLHPKSSLFTSLFGEVLKRYVFACKDAADLAAWTTALQAKLEPSASVEDDSDASDEDDGPPSGAASLSSTPAPIAQTDLSASMMSSDYFSGPATPAPSSSFTPPNADLLTHVYTLNSDGANGDGGDSSWKRRFVGLSVQQRTLRTWKHKPSARSSLQPRVIDLSHAASVKINKALSCPKTSHVPILTLTFPATASTQASYLHLAASQERFDTLYGLLSATVGRQARRDSGERDTESPSRLSSPTARRSSAGQHQSSAQHNHASSSKNRRASQDDRSAPSTPSAASTSSVSPKSQAQLLAEMNDALSDSDAMAHFRSRSVELHKGTLPTANYFRSYFRVFGKENGLRFWPDLLAILPRDEIRTEMMQLFEAHKHLFGDTDANTAAAAAVANANATAARPAVAAETNGATPLSDADEDDDEEADSSPLADIHAAMPSFTFAPPRAHISPDFRSASPVSATSASSPSHAASPSPMSSSKPVAERPTTPSHAPPLHPHTKARTTPLSSPRPASVPASSGGVAREWPPTRNAADVVPPPSTLSPSPSSAAAAIPPAPAGESESDLRDRVNSLVSAWSIRCEHHVLTLLCSLHEVLPGWVAPGEFMPIGETAPTLKEVHSTYLRAIRVLHPDKTKDKPHSMQVLGGAVFQSVQSAWASYEKSEKKKLKKEAAAAAAATSARS